MNFHRAIFIAALFVAGCSAPSTVRPDLPANAAAGTIKVYRPPSLSNYSTALFGEDGKKYLALEGDEYGQITVPVGQHQFEAWAHYAWREEWKPHATLDVQVTANTTICIMAYVNEVGAFTSAFIDPTKGAFSSRYGLARVPCEKLGPSRPSNGKY
jgi:hypothetical protein